MEPAAPPAVSAAQAQVRGGNANFIGEIASGPAFWGRPPRRPFLDEYHCLIENGLFKEGEQVELLGGGLAQMSSIDPRHAVTVDLLAEILGGVAVRGETSVRTKGPITLAETCSEPEPDLVIDRVSGGESARRPPDASEVALAIEVSDTGHAHDRANRGAFYVQAGIPECRLCNLVDCLLEVDGDRHTPAGGGALYQSKLTLRRGESVAPLAFHDFEVEVDNALPPVART